MAENYTPLRYGVSVVNAGNAYAPFKQIEQAAGSAGKKVEDSMRRVSASSENAYARMSRVAQASIGAQPGMARLAGQMGATAQLFERTSMAYATAIAGIGAASLALASVTNLQNYQERLRATTTSTQEFAAAQALTLRVARETRTDLNSTIQSYSRLSESAKKLGFEQKQLEVIMTTFQKAVQLSGAGTQEANAAALQFSQAFGSGRLNGDELRSLSENARVSLQAIADGLVKINALPGFDGTIGQLRLLAAEGKVTSEVVGQALIAMEGDISTRFGRMNVTISQAMSNLNTSVTQTLIQFGEMTGAFNFAGTAINGIANNFDTVIIALSALSAVVGTRLVTGFLAGTVAASGLTRSATLQAATVGRLSAAYASLTATVAAYNATSQAAGHGAAVMLTAVAGQRAAVAGLAGAWRGLIGILGGPIGATITALTLGLGYLATRKNEVQKAAERMGVSEEELRQRLSGVSTEVANQNSLLAQNARLKAAKALKESNESYNDNRAGLISSLRYGQTSSAFTNKDDFARVKELTRDYAAARISVAQLADELEVVANRNPGFKPFYERAIGRAEDVRASAVAVMDLRKQVELLNAPKPKAPGLGDAPIRGVVSAGGLAASVERAATVQARLKSATADYVAAQKRLADAVNAGKVSYEDAAKELTPFYEKVQQAQAAVDSAERSQAAATATTKEHTKATSDAAAAQKELESALNSLVSKFDPVRAAADEYAKTLADIAKLSSGNKPLIDPATANTYRTRAGQAAQVAEGEAMRQRAGDFTDYMAETMPDIFADAGEDAGKRAGDEFRSRAMETAEAFGQLIGGKLGRLVTTLVGLSEGGTRGDYTAMGGRVGGALTMLSGGKRAKPGRTVNPILDAPDYEPTNDRPTGTGVVASTAKPSFASGFEDSIRGFKNAADELIGGLSDLFGRGGTLTKSLGAFVGNGVVGGGIGNTIVKALGGKGSSLGSTIGGGLGGELGKEFLGKALGKFGGLAGPIGSIAGGILGGVVGGMLKTSRSAGATLTGAYESATVGGKDRKNYGVASGLAGQVQDGVIALAEQLGGALGAFNLTIGQRGKDFRVNTGNTSLKKKNGAVDFDQDADAAVAYAIQQAIQQGAIKGLRAGTDKLLKAVGDFDRNLSKAVKFESVFRRLREFTDPLGLALDDLNKEFTDLLAVFKDAGATAGEYADLEKLYGLERAKVIKETGERSISTLKDLMKELTTSEQSGLSLRDRRAAALSNYAPLAEQVRLTGKVDDQEKFAEYARTLLDIERQMFGSTDGYFQRLNEVTALTGKAIAEFPNVTSIADAIKAPDFSPVVQATNEQTNALMAGLQGLGDIGARILAAIQSSPAAGIASGQTLNLGNLGMVRF